jgi:hypothetical protein
MGKRIEARERPWAASADPDLRSDSLTSPSKTLEADKNYLFLKKSHDALSVEPEWLDDVLAIGARPAQIKVFLPWISGKQRRNSPEEWMIAEDRSVQRSRLE